MLILAAQSKNVSRVKVKVPILFTSVLYEIDLGGLFKVASSSGTTMSKYINGYLKFSAHTIVHQVAQIKLINKTDCR